MIASLSLARTKHRKKCSYICIYLLKRSLKGFSPPFLSFFLFLFFFSFILFLSFILSFLPSFFLSFFSHSLPSPFPTDTTPPQINKKQSPKLPFTLNVLLSLPHAVHDLSLEHQRQRDLLHLHLGVQLAREPLDYFHRQAGVYEL